MELDVMNLFIRLPTAKGADRSLVYDLSRKAMQMRQIGGSLVAHYAYLSALWQELDYRKPITFTQADVILARQHEIAKECVYMFLDRLDDIYDSIRSEILRTVSFPNLEYDFATVHREEQRRHTLLSSGSNASMAMTAVTTRSSALTQNRTPPKPSFVTCPYTDDGCTYCHSSKPVVEQCFKKNGYPDWWEAFQEKKTRDAREA
ncbi:hypothetical protein CerSpe_202830 [Prunus speciosa]